MSSMHLVPKLIASWPKLAWVAKFGDGSQAVEVLHGPMVEANDQWCVEAAIRRSQACCCACCLGGQEKR